MSTMTLLPCPFCGGEAQIVRAEDEDGRFAAVGCPGCGAGSRQHYFVGDDAVPHVVGAWNKRAQPALAVDVGAMDLSAPERIWLQVNPDGDEDDRGEPIDAAHWEDLTWHFERIGGQEVEYIRADLAASASPTPDKEE